MGHKKNNHEIMTDWSQQPAREADQRGVRLPVILVVTGHWTIINDRPLESHACSHFFFLSFQCSWFGFLHPPQSFEVFPMRQSPLVPSPSPSWQLVKPPSGAKRLISLAKEANMDSGQRSPTESVESSRASNSVSPPLRLTMVDAFSTDSLDASDRVWRTEGHRDECRPQTAETEKSSHGTGPGYDFNFQL